MQVMTIKDYAYQKNVTYEAVRKQVKRYEDELKDHIIVDGRQQFLDEEAVAFLDSKREKNPVVVYQASKDELIEELKRDRENNLVKIAAQADQIAELSNWKAEKALQIAEAAHTKLLLDSANRDNEALENKLTALAEAHRAEIERLKKEAEEEARALREALEASEAETKRIKGTGLIDRLLKRW